MMPPLQRREIVKDGTLDLFALNDVLNDIRSAVNEQGEHLTRIETEHLTRIEQQTIRTNGRVTALEGTEASKRISSLEDWRRKVEKAAAYTEGMSAARGKLGGFIHQSLVLAFGFGGLVIGILGQLR